MRAVVLAFVSACGLFPDVGPLASGDASVDATTSDVSMDVSSDAIQDAAIADAGDARTSPCTAQHTFCDDFDDGSLGAKWSAPLTGSGGALLSSTNAVSPPYALEARVPSGSGPFAFLDEVFTVDAQHVHFECDVMITGTQSTTMELDFVNIRLTPAPSGFMSAAFNMEQLDTGSILEEGAKANGADAATYHDDKLTMDFHAWRHLSLDIDFTAGTVTAKVDGAIIDTMTMTPPLTSAPVGVSVGVTYTSGLSTQYSVLVDNVVVDLN